MGWPSSPAQERETPKSYGYLRRRTPIPLVRQPSPIPSRRSSPLPPIRSARPAKAWWRRKTRAQDCQGRTQEGGRATPAVRRHVVLEAMVVRPKCTSSRYRSSLIPFPSHISMAFELQISINSAIDLKNLHGLMVQSSPESWQTTWRRCIPPLPSRFNYLSVIPFSN